MKIAFLAAYAMLGLATIAPTDDNLRAACRPTMTDRQALVAPLVWPITFGASLNLRSGC